MAADRAGGPGRDSVPFEEDGVEATGGVRGIDHSHSPDAGQPAGGLDRGVDAEHLRSASQGVRPDAVSDAAGAATEEPTGA